MTLNKTVIRVADAPIEAYVQVNAALSFYALMYDYGDFDRVDRVFTEDATYDIIAHPATDEANVAEHFGSAFELGLPMVGCDGIRDFLGARFDDNSPFQRRHFITNVVIVQYDGETLESVAYMLETKTPHGGSVAPEVTMSCVFEDSMVRCDDGHWRIRRRIAHPDRIAAH